MKNNTQDQSGFTIIELLLAMVFFSFILTFAISSFILINRSYVRGNNVKRVQEQARQVMSDMSSTIRLAGSSTIHFDNHVLKDSECSTIGSNFAQALSDGSGDTCINRLCVGSVRFAWNEAYIDSGDEDYSSPSGQPFRLVRSNDGGAGTEAECRAPMDSNNSIELLDPNTIVQDIDITETSNPGSYELVVSISTLDDQEPEAPGNPIDLDFGGTNYAQSCHIDPINTEFCHIETLRSLVSKRLR